MKYSRIKVNKLFLGSFRFDVLVQNYILHSKISNNWYQAWIGKVNMNTVGDSQLWLAGVVINSMNFFLTVLGPVHMYPDTFESTNFSFQIGLLWIQWIQPANPETFESTLQSGNFWIRYLFGYVWMVESGYFLIPWHCKIGLSHYSHLDHALYKL